MRKHVLLKHTLRRTAREVERGDTFLLEIPLSLTRGFLPLLTLDLLSKRNLLALRLTQHLGELAESRIRMIC